jgi:lysylphosphatidylglycerol synthetase-like protein (DUF2156 family)
MPQTGVGGGRTARLQHSFQGLRAYKAKFASDWRPLYVIYQSALDLPLLPLALERVSEIPKEE